MSDVLPRSLLCLALLTLSACARATPNGSPESNGRPPYVRSCAACHGIGGRGDGPAAAALRNPLPDLTLLSARAGGRFPRDRVVAVVVGDSPVPGHGSREMPVWSTRFGPSAGATAVASIVAQRRVEAIVDYVESLQRVDPK